MQISYQKSFYAPNKSWPIFNPYYYKCEVSSLVNLKNFSSIGKMYIDASEPANYYLNFAESYGEG